MYLIDIVINTEKVDSKDADNLLEQHRQWFAKYFQVGAFLMVGPYRDQAAAGVVIAQAPSREALEGILKDDAYYPDKATYTVREFQANLIAPNVADYKGQ
ncbi:YciI family protein [uncultured Veillonella sp.]|uniref:YciI family protein n=1 Tax=uncultured Veillonella sp. TaxID=159268 RepID=UPI002634ED55|nr:YciI family protein [uncultured Veillonella sp.]